MLLGIKWCLISDQRGKLGFLFSPLKPVLYFMANCQSSCGMEPKCILTSVPNKQNKSNKYLFMNTYRILNLTLKLKSPKQIDKLSFETLISLLSCIISSEKVSSLPRLKNLTDGKKLVSNLQFTLKKYPTTQWNYRNS